MDKKEVGSFFVAITGEVGSGKTTVSNILREYGYCVFDTDAFSKRILLEEKSIIGQIEKIVGQKISENGKLDFKKVGQIFDDNPLLEKRFEKWYQPFLGEKIVDKMNALESEAKTIFFDIPFLQQKGIAKVFDYIWIIKSEERKKMIESRREIITQMKK